MTTCNTTEPIAHKRGASVHWLMPIPAAFPDGHFVGWTVESQARTENDVLMGAFTVTWADPVTTRTLVLKLLDTAAWPIGPAYVDVKLTDPEGFVLPTSTAMFYVVKDVTHD